MKLSEIKGHLLTADTVNFKLPAGGYVPAHFHVTEIGLVTKHFIDCGGTERSEKLANFQLWDAQDHQHRLKPTKLLNIINLCERKLNMGDLEIEVEFQSDTIGKYALGYDGKDFLLLAKNTACLAKENCGTSSSSTPEKEICCGAGSSCC